MTALESASPHLDVSELTLIAKGESGAALDLRIATHLENCDECLVLLADCIQQHTSESALRESAAPSLRAVNLAAARWRADLAKAKGETIPGQPELVPVESPEARLELLLGQAAGPAQSQSPLLALFVGKRQART